MNNAIILIDANESIQHIFSVVFETDLPHLHVVMTNGPTEAANLIAAAASPPAFVFSELFTDGSWEPLIVRLQASRVPMALLSAHIDAPAAAKRLAIPLLEKGSCGPRDLNTLVKNALAFA